MPHFVVFPIFGIEADNLFYTHTHTHQYSSNNTHTLYMLYIYICISILFYNFICVILNLIYLICNPCALSCVSMYKQNKKKKENNGKTNIFIIF